MEILRNINRMKKSSPLPSKDKQELIIDCLKSTHSPMTPNQIQCWIYANHSLVAFTNKEIEHHLGILRSAGKVDHAVGSTSKLGPWILK